MTNGKRIATKNPNDPTEPIVLKTDDWAKEKGINNPNSWKTPIISATKAEIEKIVSPETTSFFEKVLLTKKYNINRPIKESKESAPDCGHPQKLPYLFTEKIVAKKYAKNKTPATMCILLGLISNFPETSTLIIHAKSATKAKRIKTVCLLKSKISAVHGNKKIGAKKANT